jgi:chromosome partitioning protein
METLAIISQKGGSGKTTLAVHMAVCAAMRGHKVALIDIDFDQGSAFDWNESREPARKFDAKKAEAAELPGLLQKAEAAGIGFTIIDTAPHTDKEATAAAKLADFVLIPCRPSRFDLRAMARTIVALQSTKTPRAIVINGAPHGFRLIEEARAALAKSGLTVLPEVVHQWAPLSHAVTGGLSIHEYEPGGLAAGEIEKLYAAVAGFLDLQDVQAAAEMPGAEAVLQDNA